MKTHVDFPERHFKRIQVLGALFSASLLLCPKWAMVSRGSLLDLQVKGKIVISVAPQAHFFNKSATLSVGVAAADGAAVSSFFGGSAFDLVSGFFGGSTRGFFGAGPTSFTRICVPDWSASKTASIPA